ncbi:hypothetical protein BC834DRAFT_322929 [Gloeopeniophorella convolvens]|nr:hypothetical protein BC834DRAFT_322929 [Gloeopeniophorella convolvens]
MAPSSSPACAELRLGRHAIHLNHIVVVLTRAKTKHSDLMRRAACEAGFARRLAGLPSPCLPLARSTAIRRHQAAPCLRAALTRLMVDVLPLPLSRTVHTVSVYLSTRCFPCALYGRHRARQHVCDLARPSRISRVGFHFIVVCATSARPYVRRHALVQRIVREEVLCEEKSSRGGSGSSRDLRARRSCPRLRRSAGRISVVRN